MAETEGGMITPELLAKVRSFHGKWYDRAEPYFNEQATYDTIVHFANGIGDLNPLFRDETYSKNTKYGGIIAPPGFPYTVQWGSGIGTAPGFTGIHAFYSGGNWEWCRPIKCGDTLKPRSRELDIVEKQGKMGGGKSIINYTQVIYSNQNNQIVAKELCWGVSVERGAAKTTGKYREIKLPTYTKEQMDGINLAYENEEIRSDKPRYWEDVKIGDKVGPIVKGPLTVRDEIAWLMGGGSPFFRAHKIQYLFQKRHPKAVHFVEELGYADVPELVHILDPFARAVGIERAYDYGCQRMSWLMNLFSNWVGDEGWLWKMRGDMRVFNQLFDTTWLEGKVTQKYRVGNKNCVEIEAWAKNQRGEYSMIPNPAVVILPSKQYGPVIYPEPRIEEFEECRAAIHTDKPGWIPVVKD
jgi:acyl dehydratase